MRRIGILVGQYGRVLFASLALVANLIAVGVPVLHAWAHKFGHGHDVALAAAAEVDHPHDEVHPLALHDDCVLVHRSVLDLAPGLPVEPADLASHVIRRDPPTDPVAPALSRAPPAPTQARAPPLA